MLTKGITRTILILFVVILNIGCDQVSKKMVRDKVSADDNIEVIGNHLTVTHVENTGAFLSVGDSLPKAAKNLLLSALPLIALILGLRIYLQRPALRLCRWPDFALSWAEGSEISLTVCDLAQ